MIRFEACFSGKGRLKGFSLAELLVALGVISIIATFNIVKIVNAQQTQQMKAIFKEDIATLNQVVYNAKLNRVGYGINANDDATLFALANLNCARQCPTTAYADGCRTAPHPPGGPDWLFDWMPACLSHNGSLYVFELKNDDHVWNMAIDANGDAGPNLCGSDILMLSVVKPDGEPYAWTGIIPSGRLFANEGCPGSSVLFDSLF